MTIFTHAGNDFIRHINHWTIEDGQNVTSDMGVILEFFDSTRGPAMLATPFARPYATIPTIEQNKGEALCWYSDDIPQHRAIMGALVSGDVRGKYAQDMVLQLIHAVFPADWAEQHLPQICARLREMGLNWDYSKMFCCPDCKSENLEREYSSGFDGYRCNDCHNWNYAKDCNPKS